MTGRVRLLVAALALIPSLPLAAFWVLGIEDPTEDFRPAAGEQDGTGGPSASSPVLGPPTNPTK